jgi:hypothetical protein
VIKLLDYIPAFQRVGVSVFVIICSTHVHWFLRPFNAMRYADAYKPQRYI